MLYFYNVRKRGEILANCMDGFPSGQRGQTVNLLQIASVVRIHLHPYAAVAELADAQDLKSCGTNLPYRFDSGLRQYLKLEMLIFSVSSFFTS